MSALPSDCDRGLVAGAAPALAEPPAHPNLVLCTSILASSLAFIDGSAVNVGLSAIGQDLAGRGADLSWVVNGYLLPLSSLLLLGGALGDHYGRKRVLLAGIAVFALASLLCGLAPRLSLLVAGRVLQGLGAALVLPNSLAILSATFEGKKRAQAVGIWAAAGAAAGAIGPLLGGWLIDTVGWRAVFYINLPIAALAIFMGWRFVLLKTHGKPVPLDPAGALLASLGLACITWGLAEASAEKQLTSWAGIALAAGFLILLAFLWTERRAGERAMLPLTLFCASGFSGLNLMTFLLYGAIGALMLLVPFVLIQALDYSAKQAGAALLPFPIVLAIGSPLMGRVAANHGSRLPLSIGALTVAGGFLLAMRIGTGSYTATVLPAMLIIALGMACVAAPLTTAVLSSVDGSHTGIASGFNSAVARGGGLIATAMLGMVLTAQGRALLAPFHAALAVCAASAAAAALCAFIWVRPGNAPPK
ncbi:EmrB/QacA subfamily drug resistance transporter [Pseudoduganella lurida]|uniref:EmrB/QacA subfamily drug resistance transporter n=1 Tax=Pseudoduganella lurida TaxID=1036180 RepID=A0A562REY1_9BURK|nr:MFS transporter [Pseudoduganella lurida]TWI67463.1 EmrB/QacA subfamily drug resistance transporter [Pseudoduganella lurida]